MGERPQVREAVDAVRALGGQARVRDVAVELGLGSWLEARVLLNEACRAGLLEGDCETRWLPTRFHAGV